MKLLIAGEWTPLGDRESEPVLNPATGECIGILPMLLKPISIARSMPPRRLIRCGQHGAQFKAGNSCIPSAGYFWEPTVISDVLREARIMNEEPFGPVAIINPFSDFDSVIKQANRLPYGLAAYAFTNNNRTVNLLGEEIEAGLIGINNYVISVRDSAFGGMKESGHGSEEGQEGLEACLVTKFVTES